MPNSVPLLQSTINKHFLTEWLNENSYMLINLCTFFCKGQWDVMCFWVWGNPQLAPHLFAEKSEPKFNPCNKRHINKIFIGKIGWHLGFNLNTLVKNVMGIYETRSHSWSRWWVSGVSHYSHYICVYTRAHVCVKISMKKLFEPKKFRLLAKMEV